MFTFTLVLFWPTVVVLPTIATVGFAVFFFLRTGAGEPRWADRVGFPVLAASFCSALVSVTANLIVAHLVAVLMAGLVGAFWILVMLALLSMMPAGEGATSRG